MSMGIGTAILRFFSLLVHWYMKDDRCTFCNTWVDEWVIWNGKNIPICPDCMVENYWCPRCYKNIIGSGETTAAGICNECKSDAIWYVREKQLEEELSEEDDEGVEW